MLVRKEQEKNEQLTLETFIVLYKSIMGSVKTRIKTNAYERRNERFKLFSNNTDEKWMFLYFLSENIFSKKINIVQALNDLLSLRYILSNNNISSISNYSKELIESINPLVTENLETMRRKNADYTSGGSLFSNFQVSSFMDYEVSILCGVQVRMLDKLQRIKSFLLKGKLEVNESVLDAIDDLINYTMIYYGIYFENEHIKQ